MKDDETTAGAANHSQTSEIIALLQQLLIDFDDLGMSLPAIKIAEAIDCLEKR